jgi:iron complex outermembrane receptor protein
MAGRSFSKLGSATALIAIAVASPALAQVTKDDALAESDDAFGTNVGLESTGIYTEHETRGFNPLDAGNVRINGIYFDQVSFLTNKLRATTAIRVGFSAVETPFVAPTGVVEHGMRPFPKDLGASLTYTRFYYGGMFIEGEARGPVMDDRVGISAGFGYSKMAMADGAKSESWGISLRSIIKIGKFEFSPYYGGGKFTRNDAKPVAVVTDGYRPKIPPTGKYLGQEWVRG